MKGRIVVVAASLHGIDALRQLVGALPADFPAPVFIVQHLGKDSLGFLPGILGRAGPLPADHPAAREKIVPGRIYVAPPDRHMLLEEGYVLLSQGPRENWVRPAADPLFRSAALAYGAAAIGVVLTGSLDDGTAGLLAIKDAGGTALVQDPQEALAPSMPRSALRHVAVDQCLPIAGLARELVRLARDDPGTAPAAADPALWRIEHRIACGILRSEDWGELLRYSAASALTCPECRGVLHEIRDPRLLRFRCRPGHAWAALSLAQAQAEAHEAQLSALLDLVLEEGSLAERLGATGEAGDDAGLAAVLAARRDLLQRQGERIAAWLHGAGSAPPP